MEAKNWDSNYCFMCKATVTPRDLRGLSEFNSSIFSSLKYFFTIFSETSHCGPGLIKLCKDNNAEEVFYDFFAKIIFFKTIQGVSILLLCGKLYQAK